MFTKMGVIGFGILAMCTAAHAGSESRPGDQVTPNFMQKIPNIPGKSLVSVVVSYPPSGISPSHHHAKSAFVYAYVLEGNIRSSADGSTPRIYKAGESWSENPGAHHSLSENASNEKPAKLLAVFVVDSSEQQLTVPDH